MSTSATAFALGTFVGNPDGNDLNSERNFEDQYNSFVRTMDGAHPKFMDAFVNFSLDPSQWGSDASWNAWSWAQSGKNYASPASGMTPVVGVPMSTNGGGWQNIEQFYGQIISGQYDSDYKAIVDAWAQQGFHTIDLRLGYEFNGTFMAWSPYDSNSPNAEPDFLAAWRHLADLVHAEGKADGVTVNTVWNPNIMDWTETPTPSLYPGDRYVDLISLDQYSHTWPADLTDWASGGTTQDGSVEEWASRAGNRMHYWQYPDANFWNPKGTGAGWSLQDSIDFAKAHGKPISLSETGAGGDGAGLGPVDDPAFPKWLAGELSKAEAEGVPVAYVNIWDTTMSDGDWMFSGPGSNKPLEAAAWGKYFGAGSGSGGGELTNGGTVGSGADKLVLNISEDRYANGDGASDSRGDANFVVLVDGRRIGGTLTATAMHSLGQTEQFTFKDNFGSGNHTVRVNLTNDAWSGRSTPTTDRNIYVDGATYDGTKVGYTGEDMNGYGVQFTVHGGAAVSNSVASLANSQMAAPAIEISGPSGSYSVDAPGTYDGSVFLLTNGNADAIVHTGSQSDAITFAGLSSIRMTTGAATENVISDRGNNTFRIGAGGATIAGGTGPDNYIFDQSSGPLLIGDYSADEGDTISIAAALQASMSERVTSSGIVLRFDSAQSITLAGLTSFDPNMIKWLA